MTNPELTRLLAEAAKREMTPEEIQAQRESWVRGMTKGCEHGVLDFEQCPQCRRQQNDRHTGTDMGGAANG